MTAPATGTARRRLTGAVATMRLLPAYLLFGVLKHVMGLPRLTRLAWQDGHATAGHADAVRVVVDGALRLSRYAGRLDRDCLQRSLVIYRALSRAGLEPRLVLGFRKPEAGAVAGHAWVEADGTAGSLTAEDVSGYVVAMSFGPGGALTEGPSPGAGRTSAPAARM